MTTIDKMKAMEATPMTNVVKVIEAKPGIDPERLVDLLKGRIIFSELWTDSNGTSIITLGWRTQMYPEHYISTYVKPIKTCSRSLSMSPARVATIDFNGVPSYVFVEKFDRDWLKAPFET